MLGFRAWRRRRLLRWLSLDPALWSEVLDRFPVTAAFSDAERARLRELSILLLHEKRFAGAAGLVVSPSMRLLIAVQAAVPLLGLGPEYYDPWLDVIVYPEEFRTRHTETDEAGVVHHRVEDKVGESWLQGPMILSWPDVEESAEALHEGYNVVIHECAHKLDMLDGDANGKPPLHRDMSPAAWTRDFSAAYADLCARVDRGEETALDPYATEDPAEFFAVLSEAFFGLPHTLCRLYPEVYAQFQAFYRQDPRGWGRCD